MKRWLIVLASCSAACTPVYCRAQTNLLVNGNFESPSVNVYYDGSDPSLADDVPGWLISLGTVDGSYILVSPEMNAMSGGTDLDMAVGPAGGSIQTAAASRPAVTPLAAYRASVTTDNYFAPAAAAFFIDWYGSGGALLSSSGGPLGDPNGGLTFEPYTQLFTINASAPALASSAGVRLTSGTPAYAGLAADAFQLSRVPEPTGLALAAVGAAVFSAHRRRRRSG